MWSARRREGSRRIGKKYVPFRPVIRNAKAAVGGIGIGDVETFADAADTQKALTAAAPRGRFPAAIPVESTRNLLRFRRVLGDDGAIAPEGATGERGEEAPLERREVAHAIQREVGYRFEVAEKSWLLK